MKTLSFWKKPLYSALIFFGTLIMLSVGYSAWNAAMSKVSPGNPLTAAGWNALVDNIADLDSRWARSGGNLVFTGGNVGVGTPSPWDALTVNGGVTATKFTTSTAWIPVPSTATWTSHMSCRRVGSMLQFNGYVSLASTGTVQLWTWLADLTLPTNCRPSIYINYISGVYWTDGAVASAGLVGISPDGGVVLLNNTPFRNFSFPGTYPAD